MYQVYEEAEGSRTPGCALSSGLFLYWPELPPPDYKTEFSSYDDKGVPVDDSQPWLLPLTKIGLWPLAYK